MPGIILEPTGFGQLGRIKIPLPILIGPTGSTDVKDSIAAHALIIANKNTGGVCIPAADGFLPMIELHICFPYNENIKVIFLRNNLPTYRLSSIQVDETFGGSLCIFRNLQGTWYASIVGNINTQSNGLLRGITFRFIIKPNLAIIPWS